MWPERKSRTKLKVKGICIWLAILSWDHLFSCSEECDLHSNLRNGNYQGGEGILEMDYDLNMPSVPDDSHRTYTVCTQ